MTDGLAAFASTSRTEELTCPVCLKRIKRSRLGKPENCDHVFCFTCIHEWAKVGSVAAWIVERAKDRQ